MGLFEQLSDRWLKYFKSSNTKSELTKMTKQDYLIFNKFNNNNDRNTYLVNNVKDLSKLAISTINSISSKLKNVYLTESSNPKTKKILTNTEKLKNILNQLITKVKNSFIAFLLTCLAIGILSILTLFLMNKKLDKFIRITSDFFYTTKEAISDTFYKSLASLISLNVVDFLEEFTKCISDYLTKVKKLITLIRYEDLDRPITILLASIGLMALALTFKYYQLFKEVNGVEFDPYEGA